MPIRLQKYAYTCIGNIRIHIHLCVRERISIRMRMPDHVGQYMYKYASIRIRIPVHVAYWGTIVRVTRWLY